MKPIITRELPELIVDRNIVYTELNLPEDSGGKCYLVWKEKIAVKHNGGCVYSYKQEGITN